MSSDLTHRPLAEATLAAAALAAGPRRVHRPEYVSLLPPCNAACPAGEDIQGWLALAQAGDFEAAWRHLIADNPLPAVHGRVCYHPCETRCNRTGVDTAVSIHAIERFLGDRAIAEGWQVVPERPPSGRRVLIVGAGPSGLSAAWHLAMRGHAVEIREAGPVAGGMLHVGIPAYRLPRAELDAEIARILDLGVRLTLGHTVTDLERERREGGFDAVFVAVGAHLSRRIDIPARDAGRMIDALSYLEDVERGAAPKLGRRVAIYGGGNTAMDAARTAKRLGADEAMIVYRRDREHMPAHAFEADEALAEGVRVHWLRSIHSIEGDAFEVELMELDEAGRPHPTGTFETLSADSLILALGQDADTGFLAAVPGVATRVDGTVVVDERMMTGAEGVFAGGDMVPDERTVTVAVGHGRKAARHIDAWLAGERYVKPSSRGRVGLDKLHLWYATVAESREQRELPLDARAGNFAEVLAGLEPDEALYEARRCFSCGNCFECDACYGACPSDAIVKLGKGQGYRYDYDRCTGCAVCFEACPCHAIEMVDEPGVAVGDGVRPAVAIGDASVGVVGAGSTGGTPR